MIADKLVVLLVINQVFVAMYIFELIFRATLSPVAVAHHIGAVTIAATAVAISLNWEHRQDATIEFLLCYVWGKFNQFNSARCRLIEPTRNVRRHR